ncbi:MAG TPA: hydantoinase B/oxoprolinase family protein, partial [Burkholderiales bacterium]|nr:hydantoinase B/oxoprolinase family protein [Burkholderiales bacterium]
MRRVDDPIFMEISWNRIISFVDEAAAALVRTAFSPIIREAEDYAVVLFDGDGNSLAQSTTSAPSFIGTLPKTIRHFIAAMKDEGWHPGDVVITNDPWIGSGHLQDISMVAPVFNRKGELVAFSGVVAHPPDMGGRWTAENREIYEEGLQIPICKLMKRGEPNRDVFNIIRRNVRVPDQVIGD